MNNTTLFNCPSCGAPLRDIDLNTHTTTCLFCGNELRTQPDKPSTVVPVEMALIKHLINTDQKDEAIKVYQQVYGGDLEEARSVIDTLENAENTRTKAASNRVLSSSLPELSGDLSPVRTQIVELLKQDRMMDAVELYQKVTSASRADAEAALGELMPAARREAASEMGRETVQFFDSNQDQQGCSTALRIFFVIVFIVFVFFAITSQH